MRTIGKKREQMYIQIRRKKKFEFYKQSRVNLIEKNSLKVNFIDIHTPRDPNVKHQIEVQCSQCIDTLLKLKQFKFSKTIESKKFVLMHLKNIKDFINENNPNLTYVLLVLFKKQFFSILLKTIQEKYITAFFKLFYTFDLLAESRLYSNVPGKTS
jgi:hypothetical protein